jgi:hypothetical protein
VVQFGDAWERETVSEPECAIGKKLIYDERLDLWFHDDGTDGCVGDMPAVHVAEKEKVMTQDEALAEARQRWGDGAVVMYGRTLGVINGCFVEAVSFRVFRDNHETVTGLSTASWEDAFTCAAPGREKEGS